MPRCKGPAIIYNEARIKDLKHWFHHTLMTTLFFPLSIPAWVYRFIPKGAKEGATGLRIFQANESLLQTTPTSRLKKCPPIVFVTTLHYTFLYYKRLIMLFSKTFGSFPRVDRPKENWHRYKTCSHISNIYDYSSWNLKSWIYFKRGGMLNPTMWNIRSENKVIWCRTI